MLYVVYFRYCLNIPFPLFQPPLKSKQQDKTTRQHNKTTQADSMTRQHNKTTQIDNITRQHK